MNGHIEGINVEGDSYGFSVYLYDTFEDYMAYIVCQGIYGFSNPIPRNWQGCKLYRVLGRDSVRRIVSAIDCMRSYA